MKIIRVGVGKTFKKQGKKPYEMVSHSVQFEAQIDEGDNPEEAYKTLKAMADEKIANFINE